ncbi:helix-turn-helix domain-containing protein [Clostridium sporogenes]|uniref:helix-turn-helix domain-containing protein n=1 Tax=Clostridium sporogenes TaxID=1509 RepID=UPI0006B29FCD|nr:helix-turn-helix transcriptional regulator [Clostridium sporogenes]
MTIGDNIKKYRKMNKLTQKEFSRKIGKSERMVQKYENNETNPPLSVISNIAQLFNVKTSDIINGETEEESLNNFFSTYEGFHEEKIDKLLSELIKEIYLLNKPNDQEKYNKLYERKLNLMCQIWSDDLIDYIKSIIEIKIKKEKDFKL